MPGWVLKRGRVDHNHGASKHSTALLITQPHWFQSQDKKRHWLLIVFVLQTNSIHFCQILHFYIHN